MLRNSFVSYKAVVSQLQVRPLMFCAAAAETLQIQFLLCQLALGEAPSRAGAGGGLRGREKRRDLILPPTQCCRHQALRLAAVVGSIV